MSLSIVMLNNSLPGTPPAPFKTAPFDLSSLFFPLYPALKEKGRKFV